MAGSVTRRRGGGNRAMLSYISYWKATTNGTTRLDKPAEEILSINELNMIAVRTNLVHQFACDGRAENRRPGNIFRNVREVEGARRTWVPGRVTTSPDASAIQREMSEPRHALGKMSLQMVSVARKSGRVQSVPGRRVSPPRHRLTACTATLGACTCCRLPYV